MIKHQLFYATVLSGTFIAGVCLFAGNTKAATNQLVDTIVGGMETELTIPGGWTGTTGGGTTTITKPGDTTILKPGGTLVDGGNVATVASGKNVATSDAQCKGWGYTIEPKNPDTYCNGKYFVCPTNPKVVKCDEIARVGDIKYSKSNESFGKGWLLCNGTTYSKTTYPKLFDRIGSKFGGSDSSPKLPNYQGVFLRGYQSSRSLYSLTSENIAPHTHTVTLTTYSHNTKVKEGGYRDVATYVYTSNPSITVKQNSGTATCPVRKALYPYIYAGTNDSGA